MDNPLRQFVAERRTAKLSTAAPDSIAEIESRFRFENWVSSAAKRAAGQNVASHIGPLSHPNAKIAPFVAEPSPSPDGYVRSGNVKVPWDSFGDASSLDSLAFMKIKLSDQRTVLDHLRDGSNEIRQLFDFANDELYELLRGQFLQVFVNSKPYPVTCPEIKQVYFPLPDGDYHLLSLVSSSGLLKENRLRLQELEWGDAAKAARTLEKEDKKANASGEPPSSTEMPIDACYQIFPGRGSMKLGGANAQNISSFNAECKGVWPLFASYREKPEEYQRLPGADYFRNLRWDSYSHCIFSKLHKIFREPGPGNFELRENRKQWLEELWLWASSFALELQARPGGWSGDKGNRLPIHQKLWLDDGNRQLAADDKGWRVEVASDFAGWVLANYRKINSGGLDAVPLGVFEKTEFRNEVAEMPFSGEEWRVWVR
jgi:CRISPR-associated protein Csy1